MSLAAPVRQAAAASIRVMVVDDSAVVRGLIARMLQQVPDIDVVASEPNGQSAVRNLLRHDVDVIILDIEMPIMDGLTALPQLLAADPTVRIIMASTLTKRNADISIRALNAGAADYIPKPSAARDISSGDDFRRDLIEKVHTLGALRRQRAGGGAARARRMGPAKPTPTSVRARSLYDKPINLRQPGSRTPGVLAVGSSTGGPQALFTFFGGLTRNLGVPIVVSQHMPPTFTAILAEHVNRATGWPCREGENGELLEPNQIYVAPGDHHLTVARDGQQRVIRLTQAPPENFCRPSVDPMLRSLVTAYRANILVAILTGMGHDGLHGSEAVVQAGRTVIAQDEATSVVWGMPGAVATAGVCSAVLPLKDLPLHIATFMGKRAS